MKFFSCISQENENAERDDSHERVRNESELEECRSRTTDSERCGGTWRVETVPHLQVVLVDGNDEADTGKKNNVIVDFLVFLVPSEPEEEDLRIEEDTLKPAEFARFNAEEV